MPPPSAQFGAQLAAAAPPLEPEPAVGRTDPQRPDSLDPLQLEIQGPQIRDPSLGTVLPGESWEQLINNRVFAQDNPPRWLLLISRDELLLIDRLKWGASRLLRFELGTLYAERQAGAFLAAATQIGRAHV